MNNSALLTCGHSPGGRDYAAPSNMLVTEPSSKTSWMARASSGAIGRIVSDANRFASIMAGGKGSANAERQAIGSAVAYFETVRVIVVWQRDGSFRV